MENNLSKNKQVVLDLLDSTNMPKGVEIIEDNKKVNPNLKQNAGLGYERLFEDLNGFVAAHEQNAKKLLEIENEKNKLKIEISQARQKIGKLNRKLHDQSRMSESAQLSYKKRLNELQTVKSDLNQKIIEISAKKRHAEEQYNRLLDTYKRKEHELESSKAQTETIRKQMEGMRASFSERLANSKKQVQEHFGAREQSFVQKLNQIKSEKDKLTSSVESLKAELSKKGNTFAELQKHLDTVKAEKVALIAANENLNQALEQKEKEKISQKDMLQTIGKKHNIVTASLKKKQEEFLELNDKYHELQEQKKTLVEKIKILTEKASEIKEAAVAQNIELEKHKAEFQIVKQELFEEKKSNTIKKHRLLDLDAEAKKYYAEIHDLKDQMTVLKLKDQDQEKQIMQLKVSLEEAAVVESQLRAGIEDKNVHHETEVRHFFKNLQAKEVEIKDLTENKEKLTKQLAATKLQVEKYIKAIDIYNVKIEDLGRNEVQLKSDFAKKEKEFQKELGEIKLEKNRIQDRYDNLEKQAGQLKDEIVILNAKITSSQDENRKLTEKLKLTDDEVVKLKERLQRALTDKNTTGASLQNSKEDLDEIRKNLIQKTCEVNNFKVLVYEKENAVKLLESNRKSLEEQIAEMSKEISTLEQKITKDFEENISLNKKIDELSVELVEASEQKANLESQMKVLELELQTEKDQNQELNNVIGRINDEAIGYKMREGEFIEKLQNLEEEKNSWDARLIDFGQEKQEQEEAFNKRIEILQEQKNSALLNLEQSNNKITELEAKLQTESESKKALEEKIIALEKEIADKTMSLNSEIEGYKAKMNDQLEAVQNFEDTIVDLKANVERFEQNEKSNLEKIDALKKEIAAKNEKSNELQKTVAKQTESEAQKFKQLQEKYIVMEKQMLEAQKIADELQAKMVDQNEFLTKYNENQQRLEQREEQLNYFSRWVDLQKQGLQNHVVKLAQELRTSIEMNPMKTYLQITEREISKVEVLLSKSNVFGAIKLQYEEQYEQLITQRDEIKGLIEIMAQEVNQRADKLTGMLKHSEFIPVPPLPPKKL